VQFQSPPSAHRHARFRTLVRAAPSAKGRPRSHSHLDDHAFVAARVIMGAYLSQPVTAKSSTDGADDTFAYGTTAMQGWRTNMEVRVMVQCVCARFDALYGGKSACARA